MTCMVPIKFLLERTALEHSIVLQEVSCLRGSLDMLVIGQTLALRGPQQNNPLSVLTKEAAKSQEV